LQGKVVKLRPFFLISRVMVFLISILLLLDFSSMAEMVFSCLPGYLLPKGILFAYCFVLVTRFVNFIYIFWYIGLWIFNDIWNTLYSFVMPKIISMKESLLLFTTK
jgi:hypothetical protein